MAELARLPGIGPRSAQRLAFHMMKAPPERSRGLAEAIVDMTERLRPCSVCFGFAEAELCPICADPRRDPSLLCAVEEPSAILPIERTNEYRGRYHVLGGALSPIDGIDPEDLRIAELVARIDADGVDRAGDRDQPHHVGRGDGAPPGRPGARPGAGHAPGQRAARRAPTSSTPTSSRSAGRCWGAGSSSPQAACGARRRRRGSGDGGGPREDQPGALIRKLSW